MSPRSSRAALAALLACTVFSQTGLNLARPLISYRAIALGGDGFAIGLITAAYAVLSLTVALPLGRYTDRTGRTGAVLLAGAALLAAAPVLLALSTSLVLVGAAAAALGFGHIVFMVGAQGYVARASGDSTLDRHFGLFTAAVAAGQMFGPLGSGLVLGGATGPELLRPAATAAFVAAGCAAAALPAAVWLSRARTAAAPERRDVPSAFTMIRSRGMVAGLFVSLALLSAVDLLTAYLPLIAEERAIPPSVVGLLLALRSAASILSRLSLGALAARWSRRALVTTSAAGAGLALAVVAAPGTGALVMGFALVAGGFLLGIGQPLTMTAVVKSVPGHARGAALALRLWAPRLGQVAMPSAAGLVAGALGATGALWLATGVLAAAAASTRATPGEQS
ncbi:MFS transporter [Amycolatopsis sp. 3B14]|uniref:MFS transporter n=1 Tax=Amycolatopsis sp. 3B14 TaxID=3243600 RepID=UPI003D95E2D6